jgi:hypothetical protein
MTRKVQRRIAAVAAAATLGVLTNASGAGAVCTGDCDGKDGVLINEVVASVTISLGTANVSVCPNADRDGNGIVELTEVVDAVNSFLTPENCLMVFTPTQPAGPTPTNTVAPSNTPTQTFTLAPSNTPAATPTPTQPLAAVCGNGVPEAPDEECDDGGTCIGGDNAGTHCTSEAQCMGQGVCTEGIKIGTACNSDDDCPGAKCIHCKPFGGDGCAANCTSETDINYDLVPGVTRICKGGTKDGSGCSVTADCPPSSPPQTPGPSCSNFQLCLGGANDSQPCTKTADCPGGSCQNAVKPGTSGSQVHDGLLQLALPLTGTQTVTIGKLRNGEIPLIIKADSVKLPAIPVGSLACACVRAIVAKSCGGTVFDIDGSATADCTEGYTAGASVCDGKKPCTLVHGEGNASSGIIGCNGLEGVNLSFTQDAGLAPLPYPPAPTPPPGSFPPVITLSGSGGPGSSVILNSSAIGTATGTCNLAGRCVVGQCVGGTNNGNSCSTASNCPGGTCTAGMACTKSSQCPGSTCAGVKTEEVSGPDLTFCSNVGVSCDNGPPCDDDPQVSRGTVATLPQMSGTATGLITNTNESSILQRNCQNNPGKGCSVDADCGADGPCLFNIGPYSYTGKEYDCSKLTANPPTAEGGNVVGAFTNLNAPTTGDIVVRNSFVIGPRK